MSGNYFPQYYGFGNGNVPTVPPTSAPYYVAPPLNPYGQTGENLVSYYVGPMDSHQNYIQPQDYINYNYPNTHVGCQCCNVAPVPTLFPSEQSTYNPHSSIQQACYSLPDCGYLNQHIDYPVTSTPTVTNADRTLDKNLQIPVVYPSSERVSKMMNKEKYKNKKQGEENMRGYFKDLWEWKSEKKNNDKLDNGTPEKDKNTTKILNRYSDYQRFINKHNTKKPNMPKAEIKISLLDDKTRVINKTRDTCEILNNIDRKKIEPKNTMNKTSSERKDVKTKKVEETRKQIRNALKSESKSQGSTEIKNKTKKEAITKSKYIKNLENKVQINKEAVLRTNKKYIDLTKYKNTILKSEKAKMKLRESINSNKTETNSGPLDSSENNHGIVRKKKFLDTEIQEELKRHDIGLKSNKLLAKQTDQCLQKSKSLVEKHSKISVNKKRTQICGNEAKQIKKKYAENLKTSTNKYIKNIETPLYKSDIIHDGKSSGLSKSKLLKQKELKADCDADPSVTNKVKKLKRNHKAYKVNKLLDSKLTKTKTIKKATKISVTKGKVQKTKLNSQKHKVPLNEIVVTVDENKQNQDASSKKPLMCNVPIDHFEEDKNEDNTLLNKISSPIKEIHCSKALNLSTHRNKINSDDEPCAEPNEKVTFKHNTQNKIDNRKRLASPNCKPKTNKKRKTIKLVINIECHNSSDSSDGEQDLNGTTYEDASFLDDFNVDDIVNSLDGHAKDVHNDVPKKPIYINKDFGMQPLKENVSDSSTLICTNESKNYINAESCFAIYKFLMDSSKKHAPVINSTVANLEPKVEEFKEQDIEPKILTSTGDADENEEVKEENSENHIIVDISDDDDDIIIIDDTTPIDVTNMLNNKPLTISKHSDMVKIEDTKPLSPPRNECKEESCAEIYKFILESYNDQDNKQKKSSEDNTKTKDLLINTFDENTFLRHVTPKVENVKEIEMPQSDQMPTELQSIFVSAVHKDSKNMVEEPLVSIATVEKKDKNTKHTLNSIITNGEESTIRLNTELEQPKNDVPRRIKTINSDKTTKYVHKNITTSTIAKSTLENPSKDIIKTPETKAIEEINVFNTKTKDNQRVILTDSKNIHTTSDNQHKIVNKVQNSCNLDKSKVSKTESIVTKEDNTMEVVTENKNVLNQNAKDKFSDNTSKTTLDKSIKVLKTPETTALQESNVRNAKTKDFQIAIPTDCKNIQTASEINKHKNVSKVQKFNNLDKSKVSQTELIATKEDNPMEVDMENKNNLNQNANDKFSDKNTSKTIHKSTKDVKTPETKATEESNATNTKTKDNQIVIPTDSKNIQTASDNKHKIAINVQKSCNLAEPKVSKTLLKAIKEDDPIEEIVTENKNNLNQYAKDKFSDKNTSEATFDMTKDVKTAESKAIEESNVTKTKTKDNQLVISSDTKNTKTSNDKNKHKIVSKLQEPCNLDKPKVSKTSFVATEDGNIRTKIMTENKNNINHNANNNTSKTILNPNKNKYEKKQSVVIEETSFKSITCPKDLNSTITSIAIGNNTHKVKTEPEPKIIDNKVVNDTSTTRLTESTDTVSSINKDGDVKLTEKLNENSGTINMKEAVTIACDSSMADGKAGEDCSMADSKVGIVYINEQPSETENTKANGLSIQSPIEVTNSELCNSPKSSTDSTIIDNIEDQKHTATVTTSTPLPQSSKPISTSAIKSASKTQTVEHTKPNNSEAKTKVEESSTNKECCLLKTDRNDLRLKINKQNAGHNNEGKPAPKTAAISPVNQDSKANIPPNSSTVEKPVKPENSESKTNKVSPKGTATSKNMVSTQPKPNKIAPKCNKPNVMNKKPIKSAVKFKDTAELHNGLFIDFVKMKLARIDRGRRFTVKSCLHSGYSSVIYKCHDQSNQHYALKISNTKYNWPTSNIQMLQRLQSSITDEVCIRPIIQSFYVKGYWCMLLDYYPCTLEQVLDERKSGFHIDMVQSLSRQLVTAVAELGNHGIIHSDINTRHIMLNSAHTQLKLCGFDRSDYASEIQILPCTSATSYRAPEAILGFLADYRIDVWATALVMYEMATAKKLFRAACNNELLYKQLSTVGCVSPELVHMSQFGRLYFSGSSFMKTNLYKPTELIPSITKNNLLRSTIFTAYERDWEFRRKKWQVTQDIDKLELFHELLEKMLVPDPRYRLPITFVIASEFIVEML